SFGFRPQRVSSGQNPPAGAVVYYYLKEKPKGEVTLEFLDPAGKLIKKFSSREERREAGARPAAGSSGEEGGGVFGGGGPPARVAAEAGLNRFVWDLRYPDATRFPNLILWAGMLRGPLVAPGDYQVRLTVDGKSQTQGFAVKKDPRVQTTPEDFA